MQIVIYFLQKSGQIIPYMGTMRGIYPFVWFNHITKNYDWAKPWFKFLEKDACNLIIKIGLLHKASSSSVVKILTLHRVRYEFLLIITSRPLHILGLIYPISNYLFIYLREGFKKKLVEYSTKGPTPLPS